MESKNMGFLSQFSDYLNSLQQSLQQEEPKKVFLFRFHQVDELFIAELKKFIVFKSLPILSKIGLDLRRNEDKEIFKNLNLKCENDFLYVLKNMMQISHGKEKIMLLPVDLYKNDSYDLQKYCVSKLYEKNNNNEEESELLFFPIESVAFIGEPRKDVLEEYFKMFKNNPK
jgi:hypothetical protein